MTSHSLIAGALNLCLSTCIGPIEAMVGPIFALPGSLGVSGGWGINIGDKLPLEPTVRLKQIQSNITDRLFQPKASFIEWW